MRHPTLWRQGLALLALSLVLALPGSAQDMQSQFEQKVTEFTLDNGLTFLVVERHEAPVVSFFTYADVGGVDEVKGITGIAHMFEHMAFKGTTTIGSKDLDRELEAMHHVDEAYAALKVEKAKNIPNLNLGGGYKRDFGQNSFFVAYPGSLPVTQHSLTMTRSQFLGNSPLPAIPKREW